MIVLLVLLIVDVLVFLNTKIDDRLKEVKLRYKKLREHLKSTNEPEFRVLHKEIPIIAHYNMSNGVIGYNADKGMEIGLCIDGTVNDIFHVLLHELAHCTVEEYSHSKLFWRRFDQLKEKAKSIGVYEKISRKKPFCGRHIMDK